MNDFEKAQLENASGLAKDVTGRFESVRHALARADRTKVTAGELAEALREKGFNVKAAELVDWYRLKHDGLDPEWHHAGWAGKGMGKTYFFPISTIDKFSLADMEIIERLRREPIPVFRVGFIRGVRKGGSRIPVAQFLLRQGRLRYGDVLISKEDYEALQKYNGTLLKPYETLDEFRTRMLEQSGDTQKSDDQQKEGR